jgi:hypothetical protein
VASCTFGFLFSILRFRARIASLGGTVLDRMTSDISRLRGMSSLLDVSRALPGRLKLETPGSSHVQARRGGALDLLVERAVAGPKPAGHGVRAGGHSGGAVSGGVSGTQLLGEGVRYPGWGRCPGMAPILLLGCWVVCECVCSLTRCR